MAIYLDGMRFGEHRVISAVGVDIEGRKQVLGIQLGATENAAAVKDPLTAFCFRRRARLTHSQSLYLRL